MRAVILKNIIYAYFMIMLVISPLYMRKGYNGLGDAKYVIFRVATVFFAVSAGILYLIPVIIPGRRIKVSKIRIDLPDVLMLVYLFVTVMSYLLSPDGADEFLGENGWHMGLVTQLLMTAVYFILAHADKDTYSDSRQARLLYYVITAALTAVFMLGILNRFSIYPFSTGAADPSFISTLGNIDWYSGFWSVTAPAVIGGFWISYGNKKVSDICLGAAAYICFLTIVTQGSEGVLLSVLTMMLIILLLSADKGVMMHGALMTVWLFTAAMASVRILSLMGGRLNYSETFLDFLAGNDMILVIFSVLTAALAVSGAVMRGRVYDSKRIQHARPYVICMLVILGAALIILTVINSVNGGIRLLDGISFLRFGDSWGNSRGTIWKSACMAFASMSPLQKLIGVGPDGFADYIYSNPEIAPRVYAVFGNVRLTNAHDVLLTLLVDYGIIGTAAYAGVFICLLRRAVKARDRAPVLYICIIMICSYAACNMTGFRNTMNTPYAFMLLGATACICRNTDDGMQYGGRGKKEI